MKKLLIREANLRDFCDGDKLYLAKGVILSPAARDKAVDLGITIIPCNITGNAPEPTVSSIPDNTQPRGHEFLMPGYSLLGFGCLKRGIERLKDTQLQKVLLVTDAVLSSNGIVQTVIDQFREHQIDVVVYDGTQPNPTISNVTEGLQLLQKNNCVCVVSLGGGSPHDCAKAIALLATNGGKISDYEGVNKSTHPSLPLVAINTTAGTASEITRFCIVTNEQSKIKMAIVDQHVTPAIAINDPELMLDMPSGLTAATGMDALTHAIEAYLSVDASPVTNAVSCKAIELIVKYLPRAVIDGSDREAREQMAYAQFMAGMAFNSAGLGYVHAMAHQLGGMYGLPHGVCNAVLLPHVMAYNMDTAAKKLSDIAYHLNCKVNGLSETEAATLGIEKVCRLLLEVNIPVSLTELGVQQEDIPTMAANALKDTCALTNPRQGSQLDIEQIFRRAL